MAWYYSNRGREHTGDLGRDLGEEAVFLDGINRVPLCTLEAERNKIGASC